MIATAPKPAGDCPAQAIQAHAWPGGEQVRVRMGIRSGEAAKTAAGLVGLEVHRAARVAAVAHGGQVLVSEAAAALVRDGLPPGAALADLGNHRLKDLGRPEHIFQLRTADLPAEFPPLRSLGNPALPDNLPAELSAFIGRDREVAEVRALVESARLVTLTGAGGCGKTRLGLHLVATCREPLGVGEERIYRVPSLSLPGRGEAGAPAPGSCDAVALFADRARANGVALSVDEQAGPVVVSVCRRLDGMPLAIELAAARLRSMSLRRLWIGPDSVRMTIDHRTRLSATLPTT